MRSWVTFYKERVFSDDYLVYAHERYYPFIDAIVRRMKDGDRIIEVGCGIATITKLLSSKKHKFCGYHCYDINPDMVELAEANLAPAKYPVEVGDARNPVSCYPDIIHSHGLLEHFKDEDIHKILQAGFKSGARVQVHYVPGDKYKEPSFGDERLLPANYWIDRFHPTQAFSFNDGYDHCLIWEV